MIESQDNTLRAVARLYYIDGLGQEEIAEIVGISRSQISRMLTRARERGIVRISVDEYNPRNQQLENELQDCFGLRNVYVIRTVREASPAVVRHALGYFGAPLISELLRSNLVIGIAGGRSIYELVSRIIPTAGTQGLTIVQLMGNVGPEIASTDAIEISRQLAQRFMGTFFTLNAPVHAADAVTRDAFLQHDFVARVMKLYESMDLALVGIGSMRDSLFIDRKMLNKNDLEKLVMQNAVGEICGHFYDRDGQECSTEYRERVIGIALDTLRGVDNVMGVVANGQDRVDAIYAAARSGLVKSLLIDEPAAYAILTKIEKNTIPECS
jgi:DNA-binding transcriptional regulator LsrR (DeoR family)